MEIIKHGNLGNHIKGRIGIESSLHSQSVRDLYEYIFKNEWLNELLKEIMFIKIWKFCYIMLDLRKVTRILITSDSPSTREMMLSEKKEIFLQFGISPRSIRIRQKYVNKFYLYLDKPWKYSQGILNLKSSL